MLDSRARRGFCIEMSFSTRDSVCQPGAVNRWNSLRQLEMSVPDYAKIATLGDFKAFLPLIKTAIREGALEQYFPRTYVLDSKESVFDLDCDDILPDVITMYFRDTVSGKKYELNVDVYHGSGGDWSIDGSGF